MHESQYSVLTWLWKCHIIQRRRISTLLDGIVEHKVINILSGHSCLLIELLQSLLMISNLSSHSYLPWLPLQSHWALVWPGSKPSASWRYSRHPWFQLFSVPAATWDDPSSNNRVYEYDPGFVSPPSVHYRVGQLSRIFQSPWNKEHGQTNSLIQLYPTYDL